MQLHNIKNVSKSKTNQIWCFLVCVIESHRLSKEAVAICVVADRLSRHKLSKKVQFDIFIYVKYRVTNDAKSRKSAKTCLHKSTLGALKTQVLGKTKNTMLFAIQHRKTHGKPAETWQK